MNGLYFDGRKDKTLYIQKIDGANHRKIVQEEHITLVSEPGGSYIGHITPRSGKAQDIKIGILKYLDEECISTTDLAGIGVDGTVVNTGHKNGVIRLLEIEFDRPLQWLVCQLHGNELPLRHLFMKIDGKTSGPNAFSGSIGQKLKNCHLLPVVNFVPIAVNLPQVPDDISTDQKYLYDICQAVSNGCCPAKLANRHPGTICHSRWLTTANNLLRLYISMENPSNGLIDLVTYVVKVYAPTWFQIKLNPKCINGAKNLWFLIEKSRYLTQENRAVVDPVIQRNGFFGHPESILLSMLADESRVVRELAVLRIRKARENLMTTVREFKIPKLNFYAQNYSDMINWNNCLITDPPLLRHIEIDELEYLVSDNDITNTQFTNLNLPCHSQTVERYVKVI